MSPLDPADKADKAIIEGKPVPVSAPISSDEAVNEKSRAEVDAADAGPGKDGALETTISAAPSLPLYDSQDKDTDDEGVIIITGADAAAHLLPMRDDGEPSLTFRSLFLATILSSFQAVMSQIYTVSQHVGSNCLRAQRH